MTRRAARMLAALEAGCETRAEIFDHQDGFSLLNNCAAELRAAGIDVECVLVEGVYHYRLLDDGRHDDGAGKPSSSFPVAPIVEQESGQLALEVAA